MWLVYEFSHWAGMYSNTKNTIECRAPNNVRKGGIRGIVELKILRQIEKAMGGRLNIHCFFDLIVGTRSGLPSLCWLRINMWADEVC